MARHSNSSTALLLSGRTIAWRDATKSMRSAKPHEARERICVICGTRYDGTIRFCGPACEAAHFNSAEHQAHREELGRRERERAAARQQRIKQKTLQAVGRTCPVCKRRAVLSHRGVCSSTCAEQLCQQRLRAAVAVAPEPAAVGCATHGHDPDC